MSELLEQLRKAVGERNVLVGASVHADYTHDEALTTVPVVPLAVVMPASTDEVSEVLRLASEHGVPVVARGSGTGLSGAAVPVADGILLAFDRMKRIVEIDTENQVAVVEPGVTLEQLNGELAPLGLIYPVSPGEQSGSLGGNVATNAGGMRAVRYGVTRHHVLGLEVVLADGTVMRTGGKFVKCSSGYDLTQLLIGSEGTLAITTQVTVKLQPRFTSTVDGPGAVRNPVARWPTRCRTLCRAASTRPFSNTSTSWSWVASPRPPGSIWACPRTSRPAPWPTSSSSWRAWRPTGWTRTSSVGRPAGGAGRARRVRPAPDVGGAAHCRPGAGVLRRQGGRV